MSREAAASRLGIPIGASAEEAAKAYRKKALLCHPDRYPSATAQFHELSQAYETFLKHEIYVLPLITPAPFHFDTSNDYSFV